MKLLKQRGYRGIIFLLMITCLSCKNDYVTIPFDSEKEVSGLKFSLDDIYMKYFREG